MDRANSSSEVAPIPLRDSVPVLDVVDVRKSFGGVHALRGVSLSYDGRRPLGLIGPNGSGKSTLVNVISGIESLDQGNIRFGGQEIGGKAPAAISRLGLRRSFQERAVFDRLTVRQNLLVAARYAKAGHSIPGELGRAQSPEEAVEKIAVEFGLTNIMAVDASGLSFGDARKVGIAMALCGPCGLLLLDEPAAGLNPEEVTDLVRLIRTLSGAGLPLVVIDHNMSFIDDVCDEVLVLDSGNVIARGLVSDVRRDRRVIDVYLGNAGRTGSTS